MYQGVFRCPDGSVYMEVESSGWEDAVLVDSATALLAPNPNRNSSFLEQEANVPVIVPSLQRVVSLNLGPAATTLEGFSPYL
jgi:hypothetical protein